MTRRFASLSDALGVGRGQLVALVGGGGKTSALLILARELSEEGLKVVATTTTRVGQRVATAMTSLVVRGDAPPDELGAALSLSGPVFLSAGRSDDGKFLGVDPWLPTAIRQDGLADVVLVEADGARHMPLKAPGDHEPRIPEGTDLVLPMAGLDALGLRIEEGAVHRPELVRRLTDTDVVTPRTIADVLTSDSGGLKGVPADSAVFPVLNKLDCVTEEEAQEVAELVLAKRPDRIQRALVASLHSATYMVVSGT